MYFKTFVSFFSSFLIFPWHILCFFYVCIGFWEVWAWLRWIGGSLAPRLLPRPLNIFVRMDNFGEKRFLTGLENNSRAIDLRASGWSPLRRLLKARSFRKDGRLVERCTISSCWWTTLHLVNHSGGLPLALTQRIESDLRALEKLRIKPVFVFPGLLPNKRWKPHHHSEHVEACTDVTRGQDMNRVKRKLPQNCLREGATLFNGTCGEWS
jgi:hypothetical protein